MIKRTILIVDDQSINRTILGNILEKDYEILYACDGKEAMECLQEHADIISAVILDIVMPVMNGYEVLQAMQMDSDISKVPVIVSSPKDGDEDEIRALSLGAQDFIAKPYKAEIIKHRLKNLINLRETAAMVNKTERDELTGLYNKHFFIHKVREMLENNPGQKYDLICVGIERFKLINDTYGTSQGDKILAYVGSILQEACQATNICGRFNADIFYGLLIHRDTYENSNFQPWIDKIHAYPLDMDIKLHSGVYMIHDGDMAVTAMCDRAQLAAEKNRGKYDQYFCIYDESLREKIIEEQFILSHMQTALEKKEFVVYYQPKYDLSTEQIVGAEALVRWMHPEKGFMSPGTFIPIFEKNGFITQMDEYVWEVACKDIRSWMDKGYHPVAVSVNVSRADIYNPKLIDTLLGLIAKYKIPMEYFHLEITESAYTENPMQIVTVVGKLRELGFAIEMDDFGSGYSSLNMLADMPVDVLKLDIGFIQSETRHTSGKGILSFVISLAKWLNLEVVAEGVETRAQVESLRSMECNYVQGFYYAKPMNEKSFEVLLQYYEDAEMVSKSRLAETVRENNPEDAMKKGRVMLVVDDIRINRVSLAAVFHGEYEIVECENGKNAWEYLKKYYDKVDIVMTDLLMPVMDGFQLLEKIRSDERMKNLPVIVTSQGDADTEERVLNMHADDFISKPYNSKIIHNRVAKVIDSVKVRRYRERIQSEEKA